MAHVRFLTDLTDPPKTPQEIDRLTWWDPLPVEGASIYGRFFYRLKNHAGDFVTHYDQTKYKVINSRPPDGEILFP
jgi:hypothetical protein